MDFENIIRKKTCSFQNGLFHRLVAIGDALGDTLHVAYLQTCKNGKNTLRTRLANFYAKIRFDQIPKKYYQYQECYDKDA